MSKKRKHQEVTQENEKYNIFHSLKKKKWREYWEHTYHRWGKYVFDEGKGKCLGQEDGFYHSISQAYKYVSINCLNKELTVDMYSTIHKIATQHF